MELKVYRSSAGSGKTFTLTKEYIKALLVCPSSENGFVPYYFRFILAITFTNDAAHEMKMRVLDNLKGFAKQEASDLLDIIIKEIREEFAINLKPKEVFDRSKRIYEEVLQHLSDLNISTIDAFSQKLVQCFKQDLNIPYNFNIESEENVFITQGLDKLYKSLSTKENKWLTNWVIRMHLARIEKGKTAFLEHDLKAQAKSLFREQEREYLKDLGKISTKQLSELEQKIKSFIDEYESYIKEQSKLALACIERFGLEKKSFYRSAIYTYFEKYAQNKQAYWKENINSYLKQTIDQDKWYTKTQKAHIIDAIHSAKAELYSYFQNIINHQNEHKESYKLAMVLKLNIYALGILGNLQKHLQEIKEEQDWLHFSDFTERIHEIVKNEPVPYIYERLGEKYKHIFIDEFQDTSRLQWYNLIPLLSNTLYNNSMSMLVGDAKQSIYRWRDSSAEMLVQLPNIPGLQKEDVLHEHVPIFNEALKTYDLDVNYRSRENIVDFNNSFFSFLLERFGQNAPKLGHYYKTLKQKYAKPSGGQVQFNTLTGKHTKEAYQALEIERVYDLIQESLDAGFALEDMAILCRTNAEGSYIAQNLIEREIAVISSDSLLLKESPIIQFLISALRVLHDIRYKNDIMNMCQFIQLELQNKQADYEHSEIIIKCVEASEEEETLWSFFKQTWGYDVHTDYIRRLSLVELVQELYRVFNLEDCALEQAYLQRFLDWVWELNQAKVSSLVELLEAWDKKSGSLSVNLEGNGEALSVMTIHKSKGLQFPVVFMVGMRGSAWNYERIKDDSIWVEVENEVVEPLEALKISLAHELIKETFPEQHQHEISLKLIDMSNMIYVASTRAEQRLYVFTDMDKKTNYLSSLYQDYLKHKGLEGKALADWRVYDLYEDTGSIELKNSEKTKSITLTKFKQNLSRRDMEFRMSQKWDEEGLGMQDFEKPIAKGNLIHKAFEYINYKEDVDFALSKLYFQGFIGNKDYQELTTQLKKVLDLPEISVYFDSQVPKTIFNERTLLRKGKGSYRPDRMVIMGKELSILDYKTGEEDIAKHAAQLRRYAHFFQHFGFERIKTFIVYTDSLRVVSA